MEKQFVKEKGRKVIETYIYRYPQLTIPPSEGRSNTEEYKDIVLRGKLPSEYPSFFSGTEEDCIFRIPTPIGEVEILYLADRIDFETCVQVLAYKCEKKALPASMGAIHIGGVHNWRKIYAHKKQYLNAGNLDWREEFRRFTAEPENYKDTVLLVSKGNYSALSAEQAGCSAEEWLEQSLTIRIYHELTHLICRKQYPYHKDVLLDEIIADCIGIYKAYGFYDTVLAEKILGVEGNLYRPGGRLENYVKDSKELPCYHKAAKTWIRRIHNELKDKTVADCWDLLDKDSLLKYMDKTKKENL